MLAAGETSVAQTLAGLLGLGMFTMLAISICLWGRIARWGPRSVGIDLTARPVAVSWGLVDLLLYLVIFGVTLATAQVFVLRRHEVKPPIELSKLSQPALIDFIWANSAGTVLGTAVAAGLILLRHGRRARLLGCELGSFSQDVYLGVVGFLLLVPPTLLVQLALTQFFPSQHPLIEAVRRNPEPRFLWASGFAAVAVAPLIEELQFRVLLQGWFQNLASRVVSLRAMVLGGEPEVRASGSLGELTSSASAISAPADVSFTIVRELGAAQPGQADGIGETIALDGATRVPWWPVFASAALFAAAHMSHGPDPIPLFLLATGLGVLYRQTGRIWPSVVVHFLLNLWTLLAMTVSLALG